MLEMINIDIENVRYDSLEKFDIDLIIYFYTAKEYMRLCKRIQSVNELKLSIEILGGEFCGENNSELVRMCELCDEIRHSNNSNCNSVESEITDPLATLRFHVGNSAIQPTNL